MGLLEKLRLSLKLEENMFPSASLPISSFKASNRDHSDVHYLYKLRKALVLLVGNEGLKGYSEDQLIMLHELIVKSRIDSNQYHYYDEWDSDLDSHLSEDLKLASDGYNPPVDSSLFDLEDKEESIYRTVLEENDAIQLWTAPKKRSEIPSNHFLDQKNKKYPYKNKDGSINCGGLKAAYNYAKGARGAPKRPQIASKAKRLITQHCSKKKATELLGRLSSIKSSLQEG